MFRPGYYMMYGGNGLGFLGFLPMVIFWGLVIFLIVVLVRSVRGEDQNTTEKTDNAMEIIKVRYAKGEIDKKEFEEMKKDLK